MPLSRGCRDRTAIRDGTERMARKVQNRRELRRQYEAAVQPDPLVFLGTAGDIMEAAAAASTADDVFFRLEDAGVMLRIDRSLTPTMAKTPTIGQWEIDRLRTVAPLSNLIWHMDLYMT